MSEAENGVYLGGYGPFDSDEEALEFEHNKFHNADCSCLNLNPTQAVHKVIDLIHVGRTDWDEVLDILTRVARASRYAIYIDDADLVPDEQDLEFYEDEQKACALDAVNWLLNRDPDEVHVTTPDGRTISVDASDPHCLTVAGD